MAITTGVRLEVENNLYQLLQTLQQQIRIRTGRKISLAAIISQILTTELNRENHIAAQLVEQFYKSGKIPLGYNGRSRHSSKIRKGLLEEAQQLKEKEESLNEERMQLDREKQKIFDHYASRNDELSRHNKEISDLRIEYLDKMNGKNNEIGDLQTRIRNLECELRRAKRP